MFLLLSACTIGVILDTADTATDTGDGPEPAPTSEETYPCAAGGPVTHTHGMQTAVWPGVTDLELWTVYSDAYRSERGAELGYDAPAIDVSDDVSLDEAGRVLVVCHWIDGLGVHAESAYTLVVRG